MNRIQIHQTFVERFHVGKQPSHYTEREKKEYESELSTSLPQAFVDFMTTWGPVSCTEMLGLIVDSELELWDVYSIGELKESIESTKVCWTAGMPDEYVIFGNDSMGNVFCFKRTESKNDDSPVFVFDYDYCEMNQLSDTFDDWLSQYIDQIPDKRKTERDNVGNG